MVRNKPFHNGMKGTQHLVEMRSTLLLPLLVPLLLVACSQDSDGPPSEPAGEEAPSEDAGKTTDATPARTDSGASGKSDSVAARDSGAARPDSKADTKADAKKPTTADAPRESGSAASAAMAELEDGTLVGAEVSTDTAGFSGTGYVAFRDTGEVTVEVTVPQDQLYSIIVRTQIPTESGNKTNDLKIDGKGAGSFVATATGAWSDTVASAKTFLTAGTHRITISKSWGWTNFDSIELRFAEVAPATKPSATPVNPDATDEAKRLLKFLVDHYGQNIVSGQQDLTWQDSVDMSQRVFDVTGKRPALMGFDLMNYNKYSSGSGLKQIEEAIAWWERGGMVAFVWHWRMGTENSFYAAETKFRIDMDPSSEAYKAIVKDIDDIAEDLKALADAKVPVLFRPLHEASGGWFWWGASGPEPYRELYRFMYDRLTNYHKLNNLLWVWNGQDPAWYPGNAYADVVGEDIYPEGGDHSSQVTRFQSAVASTEAGEPKLVALTENGTMPDPALLQQDGAWWSWFMTWNDGTADKDNFWSSEAYTSAADKKTFYANEYVLTLDELPNLKTYPLE